MNSANNIPTEQDAIRILKATLGKEVKDIHRFSTGVTNYVYGVTTTDGQELVVRLTTIEKKFFFEGAIHWHKTLMDKGVPLAALYYSTTDESKFGFPVMIMQRLEGKDLGEIYQDLTNIQKKELAKRIAIIQRSVATLPMGHGFGYASSVDDPSLRLQWIDVLDVSLERSQQRIKQIGAISSDIVDRVKKAIHSYDVYFALVKPECFLDDTTTKNVMIKDGRLSGIVDVDTVAYGDSLFPIALTRMSLLAKGYDTKYVDYWIEELNITAQQREALNLYSAIFCVDFMGEIGQSFNKEQAEPVDLIKVKKYKSILDFLLHE